MKPSKVKELVSEARKKGSKAASNARKKAKKGEAVGAGSALLANALLGGAHRYAAHKDGEKILKGRKYEELSRDEQVAYAKERAEASVPHVGMLGEAGTYGLVGLVAGYATGSRVLMGAGIGLAGTEVYLQTSGQITVDKEAAKRQGGTAITAALNRKKKPAVAGEEGTGGAEVGYDPDDDDDGIPLAGVIAGTLEGDDDDDDADAEMVAALEGMDPQDAEELILAGEEILAAEEAELLEPA